MSAPERSRRARALSNPAATSFFLRSARVIARRSKTRAAEALRSMSSTKFASGPGFGFLDHAPELKSLGIDCFLDRSAREVVRRSVIGTDRAGGGPGTMALRQLAAREVARERPQTSPRFRLENINSHDLHLSAVDDGRQTCRRRRGPRRQTGYSLYARPWAATIATCHAPHECRRERDRSLCHRRLYRSCVMADDGVTVRSIHAIVQGI